MGVFLQHYINGERTSKEETASEGEFDFFPVYGADQGANDLEVNFYIRIQKYASLTDKLNIIADHLSRYKFNYLPLKVMTIDDQEGRKIAQVNLDEHQWNKGTGNQQYSGNAGFTWSANYFQGTTGGWFTSQTLIQTFLQNHYKGEWIDGVEFFYEGEPIGDWDHIQLKHTVFRTPQKIE